MNPAALMGLMNFLQESAPHAHLLVKAWEFAHGAIENYEQTRAAHEQQTTWTPPSSPNASQTPLSAIDSCVTQLHDAKAKLADARQTIVQALDQPQHKDNPHVQHMKEEVERSKISPEFERMIISGCPGGVKAALWDQLEKDRRTTMTPRPSLLIPDDRHDALIDFAINDLKRLREQHLDQGGAS